MTKIGADNRQHPKKKKKKQRRKNNDDDADPSCRPPSGSTYLTIGQDLFSIQEYVTSLYNQSLHEGSTAPLSSFSPAAVMVYTSLFSIENGTSAPTDYGSGIEYADGLLNDLFPGQRVGLQMGLWLEGSKGCDEINEGAADDYIRRLARYLKTSTARRVFLRVGYEFDNPAFGFTDDPASYVAAFRRIVTMVKGEIGGGGSSRRRRRDKEEEEDDVTRVLFVWHSWGAPTSGNLRLLDFYPGDEYVDWIGVSIFQQFYNGSVGGSVADVTEVLDFAYLRHKPTMIAESSPFGGFSETEPWDNWYEKVLNIVNEYDISMWSYINCDWESQPMWRGVGFGESRISANEEISNRWRTRVIANTSRFLGAGSLSDCGGGIEEDSTIQNPALRDSDWGSVMAPHVRGSSEWNLASRLVLGSAGMLAVACAMLVVRRVRTGRWRNRLDYESVPIVTFQRGESMNVVGLNEGRIILSRAQQKEPDMQLTYM
mmetsp:Transcript_32319/g.39711  ORF Transcript_32319/g.39711 Transcript_32319/m.39711 type:complete len:484 (-) Transcript_32319:47-1498(-)|eukprot:CAMPEP_0172487098 /NCGR_PEP_ID=MMETSP1066-20121228/15988_1 /TAXON_ID=671091 /ORGANISM="Coscinodiscus wailesii, Strain CCMP2513" /LENGTH=483 /DNA_ID=CAMNT_0013253493 /DNA_START=197 /DNA_END=1648 /DNA_ORIENTATION=-